MKSHFRNLIYCFGISLLFLSCEDNTVTPSEEEPEINLQFESKSNSIPINSKRDVILTVEPVDKASLVEIINTDDKVISISKKTIKDGKITISVEGINLGTATISAVLDDKYEECKISVEPVSVESLSLDATEIDLDIYKSYTFSLTINPNNATAPVVDWASSDGNVAIVNRGTVVGMGEGSAVITASVGDIKAECKVNVHIVKGESLTLDTSSAEITEGETFITTATVLPEDVTVKSMKWSITSGNDIISYEIIDPKEDDNQTSAKVTGLKEGKAILRVECAGLKAECQVEVKAKEVPIQDAKIGDYFYSDGTWSDGGFLGYDTDGLTIKWADPKPAPIEGKTVIGIVFQTDQTRISDTEKSLGFNHGLVMAIRSAHKAGQITTMYSLDSEFDKIPNNTIGSSWYKDIEGYQWTQEILAAYPGEKIQQCPAFDWTTTDFTPSAPTNTSGWYVPSIGQVWDLLSAFGGGEIAAHLKKLQTYSRDITYYYSVEPLSLTYNPIDELNSVMSKVPQEMKENFQISGARGSSNLCEIMSSSLYDNTDGAVCIFWLYDKGELETTTDWTNQSVICRPILSF